MNNWVSTGPHTVDVGPHAAALSRWALPTDVYYRVPPGSLTSMPQTVLSALLFASEFYITRVWSCLRMKGFYKKFFSEKIILSPLVTWEGNLFQRSNQVTNLRKRL